MKKIGPFGPNITHGDKYGPAMKILDEDEAEAYFAACVEHTMKTFGTSREEAESSERMNLGYWAGYYDPETRARVERLFRCEHPVFGKIADKGPPSPEEAFAAGVRFAEENLRRSS